MRIVPDPDGDYRRRRRQRRPRRRWRTRLLAIAVSIALCSVLPVLGLRWLPSPGSAFMVAAWVQARAAGDNEFSIHYDWTARPALSPHVALAVIAAEDQRFHEHSGFDFKQIRAALTANDSRVRGASTLSQQVAKNLFLWPARSWLRKGLEAWFTLWIELLWDKRRILEVYLNIAQFGDGVYGVSAASQRFFGVSAHELSLAQATRLAAVLPNPLRYLVRGESPIVTARQRWIETQMRQLGGVQHLRAITW